MKKILIPLVVCSLSICGNCFGDSTQAPWSMNSKAHGKSSLVKVQSSEKNRRVMNSVDIDKVTVKDADKGFINDWKNVNDRNRNMSDEDFARKYGTKDGVVFRLKGDWNVFVRYRETSSGKTFSRSFYSGDPIEGLEQLEEDSSHIDDMFEYFRKLSDSNRDFFGEFFRFVGVNNQARKKSSFFHSDFDGARVHVQEKKCHSWLKNVSLLSTGALIGGGLVVLETNPKFYGNVISSIKDFCRDAISGIGASNSWKVVSGFCSNLYETVKGFF